MKSYCTRCNTDKNIDEFYRCNLSQCINCKKKAINDSKFTKSEILEMIGDMYSRLNSMDIVLNEIYKCLKSENRKKHIYIEG